MSHFTLLVIDEEDIESALSPFWELDLNREEMKEDDRAEFVAEFKKEDLEKEFIKFKKDNKDKYVSMYEYSDNDGQLHCILEHGDVFDNVEYKKTSHH